MCGPKRDEVTRGWRKLHDEFHNFFLTDIIKMKSRTIDKQGM
jgi:hypothetical protein